MIVCAGEALFDFISTDKGKSVGESETFEKRPGGAPLNVAVGLARLGNEVAYLTKLSDDSFGIALRSFMKNEGISVDFVGVSRGQTTLAFVSLDEEGKPDFVIYREGTADTLLEKEEVDPGVFEAAFFHLGSIAMIPSKTAETLMWVFEKLTGRAITSFDPNVRPPLISDKKEYLDLVGEALEKAEIVKLSDADLEYLIGEVNLDRFVRMFGRERKVTFLTLGSMGSIGMYKGKAYEFKAKVLGEVVDTTGCGDAYMAGLIHVFSREGISSTSVEKAGEFASVVAGVVATRIGGASAMPRLEELEGIV